LLFNRMTDKLSQLGRQTKTMIKIMIVCYSEQSVGGGLCCLLAFITQWYQCLCERNA